MFLTTIKSFCQRMAPGKTEKVRLKGCFQAFLNSENALRNS
jgi:hypothetical protein